MTGGCTCPIYYQGVVSVEKGSVIIRYKLVELIKIVCEPCSRSHVWSTTMRGVEPCYPAAMFQSWLGEESNPVHPQPCFKHDRRVYLSDILSGSCECWKRKCDNSIQISWTYQNSSWTLLAQPCFNHAYGGESNPAHPQPCFKHERRMYLSNILPGSGEG